MERQAQLTKFYGVRKRPGRADFAGGRGKKRKTDQDTNLPRLQEVGKDLEQPKRGRGRPPKNSNPSPAKSVASAAKPPLHPSTRRELKAKFTPQAEELDIEARLRALDPGHNEPAGPSKEAAPKARGRRSKVYDLEIVEEQDLRTALASGPISHEKEQAKLMHQYRARYPHWHFRLRCGFSLLCYGFGSKRTLLEDFASTALSRDIAVVVNGYLSGISMKQVIYTAADALWQHLRDNTPKDTPWEKAPLFKDTPEELLAYLGRARPGTPRVTVVVHSADGPGLRSPETQTLLGQLAACQGVQMVASVDHVYAALLWDQPTASNLFNWWWEHTPTFATYAKETAHLPFLLAPQGAQRGVRSALVVLRNLTPHARGIFRVLAKHQLQNATDQGLTVHTLFTLCREGFLVNSELTLRTHLTEFKDHQVVRTRKGSDGQDGLYIPLPEDAIENLLNELDNE